MLKENTNITITQQNRTENKTLFFDFVNSWEFAQNWEDLSAQGKIVLPKNIYATNTKTNKRFPLFGVNKNIGGFNGEPILKRGDKIKIESSYDYWDENLNQKKTPKTTIVEGFITKVNSGMPIEIDFEDNMYLLKQTPMKNQSFKPTQSIESILNEALKVTNDKFGTKFYSKIDSSTTGEWSNGLLTTENETIAEFLAKLKRDSRLFTYFKGNELRLRYFIYNESESQTKIFQFQKNIISSDLEYKRKDDIVLSAVGYNHIEEDAGTTKKGIKKTKNKRIEVLVTLKGDSVISKLIKQGDAPDPNTDGERRKFPYPFAKTENELIECTTKDLKKYYYSGFKGKFTTFGTPYVSFGDNAQLINPILPEQNGTYKIKGVSYSGGVNGYRQIIELDYRLNI